MSDAFPSDSVQRANGSAPVLPHEGPMRWIQRASVSADGGEARAVARIGVDHPFLCGGFLLSAALIELLAQAAASGSAMKAAHAGRRVKQGVLAAIREFAVHAPVAAGATVELLAVHEKTFGALSQARLEARVAGALIAEARMTFHLTFE